jgi:hypothetical protein
MQLTRTRQQFVLAPAAPADDHRQALELGKSQQLDRCEERIHVEMRDESPAHRCRISSG